MRDFQQEQAEKSLVYTHKILVDAYRDHSFSTYAQKEGVYFRGLIRCAYAVRTGVRGSRSLRTYCDWVVSNAELDHLTQVNSCASAGQVNFRTRTGGEGV